MRLAIDDFGNGSTTLAYLGEFAVDILKIDRSFIRGMSDNPEGRILVQAILDLARALHLDTVAEGDRDAGAEHGAPELGMRLGPGPLLREAGRPRPDRGAAWR